MGSAIAVKCYNKDTLDSVANFFKKDTKNALKTTKTVCDFAACFFENSPLAPVAKSLKTATSHFALGEMVCATNEFKLDKTKFSNGKITKIDMVASGGNLINKTCGTIKWLWENKLIVISKAITTKINILSSVGGMISFGRQIYKSYNTYTTNSSADKNYHLSKLAKFTSLFALNFFGLIATVFANLFSPELMLALSTISLFSSYYTYSCENPVAIKKPEITNPKVA